MKFFTPGMRLQPHQQQPVMQVLERLADSGYDRIALQEQLGELVELLAPACRDEDDCWCMVDELAEWVQWKRAPAYCLAHVFQTPDATAERISAHSSGPAVRRHANRTRR